MIIQKTHPLVRPLPRLANPLAGAARRALRASLDGFAGGYLEVALPDGERWCLGDPAHPDRARATIHHDRVFARALLRGELGIGEAYVAGEWDASDLVGVLRLFARNLGTMRLENRLTRLGRLPDLVRHRVRTAWRHQSERNIHAHYDLGNDFYQLFLDPQMVYSCAIFAEGDDLEAAQTRKLEQVCRTLELGPDDHLLEIGCGWGALALHAARTRGCRVTAVTISRAQLELARARVAAAGLEDRIDVRYTDYRELHGRYTAIASIEMLEAVGLRGLPGFFAACDRLLDDGGRALIQTITMPDERFEAYTRDVDWMQTYIFPGALIPSLGIIERALAATRLRIADRLDIGLDYAPTLAAWRGRFNDRLEEARALGVDLPFERSWNLYLAFSEASFAEGTLGDSQLLLRRGTGSPLSGA